jgi:hypothetical protein
LTRAAMQSNQPWSAWAPQCGQAKALSVMDGCGIATTGAPSTEPI